LKEFMVEAGANKGRDLPYSVYGFSVSGEVYGEGLTKFGIWLLGIVHGMSSG
jgi:hypothetical protein